MSDPHSERHSVTISTRALLLITAAVALVGAGALGGAALVRAGGSSSTAPRANVAVSPVSSTVPTRATPAVRPHPSTTRPAPTTSTTVPPPTTTTPPTVVISGTAEYLSDVSFQGSIDGQDMSLLANGAPCPARDGYSDLVAGGAVELGDSGGAVHAVTALGVGHIVNEVKSTQSERRARAELIDAIYDLRVAETDDPVQEAQLQLDRATQHLHDDQQPGPTPGPFEGHAFIATWCHLDFVGTPIPVASGYTITVTHRGTTVYSAAQLQADRGHVTLVVG